MIKRSVWRDFFENIIVAILLALIVRTFLWTGYRIPTNSMSPTLLPGDFIFAFRPSYGIRIPFTDTKFFIQSPSRGDIVVFAFPELPRTSYVKRVVGLPGDRIEIKNGILYVNDTSLDSKGTETPGQQISKSFGPMIVPPNEAFLMSDNRDDSNDSRYLGTVPFERIEGKAQIVWLSLDWSQASASLASKFPMLRRDRLFMKIQ